MKEIFIDFEMHPIDWEYKKERKKCSNEIIEFGAVMLDSNLNECSSFKSYVKPVYSSEIHERLSKLTGITTEMIENQPDFKTVLEQFVSWCIENTDDDEEFTVNAWSETDLNQLRQEIKLKKIEVDDTLDYIISNWNDFQLEFSYIVNIDHRLSLEKALELAGLDFEGQKHDALCDARNTSLLFVHTENDDEFLKTVERIKEVLRPPEPATISLGELMLEKGIIFGND